MEIHIKNNKKILISRLVLNLKTCSEKSTKTYLSTAQLPNIHKNN